MFVHRHAPDLVTWIGGHMAVKNPTSKRRTAESHFLAVSLAVLLYFVLPPKAVIVLSIAILGGFVVSELVSRW